MSGTLITPGPGGALAGLPGGLPRTPGVGLPLAADQGPGGGPARLPGLTVNDGNAQPRGGVSARPNHLRSGVFATLGGFSPNPPPL
jgi:hypothetical protein